MNIPYEPSSNLSAKIARKVLPLRARRNIHFKLERPIVSFTFDDFPRSAIDAGARVLEQENWAGTFYTCAGLVGYNNHHGEHFQPGDLLALEQAGHEIGGHTYAHKDCAILPLNKVLDSIKRNKIALRDHGVKGKIRSFAFPYGSATVELKRTLAEEYESLRSITPGIHTRKADLNGLKSAGIFSHEINNVLALIDNLQHTPGWLTLFAHDIRQHPSQWGCTKDEFKSVVEAVKRSEALVLPVGDAVTYLKEVT